MEEELIYWRHPTVPGIKVEEITGGDEYSSKLWLDMAYQIYGENGRDSFRETGHFQNGAPFLYGDEARISVSHTNRMLVVATLPRTPECDLSQYSPRASMGVDVERCDRSQVLKIRNRFLTPDELQMVDAENIEQNIVAWTSKEAAYKALLGAVTDFKNDIVITRMPKPGPATVVPGAPAFDAADYGQCMVTTPTGQTEELRLYSYESDGYMITLAFSPRCAKFGSGK